MHLTAYFGLLIPLFLSMAAACFALYCLQKDYTEGLKWVERGHVVSAALISFASMILLMALMSRDYSFMYVFKNVNNTMPLVYTLTAFWGGREGSLLFWELLMTLSGMIFLFSPGYKQLSDKTRLWFWVFFLGIQAFFLLLLTGWSNPFVEATPAPANGRGMNPLLMNPGMIFHPPLLFMGYAGYALPAALALGAALAGEKNKWIEVCQNWNILAWVTLSAGIILGGWWSYMELGWGGYWAWDPVENASLIPWFSATAFFHTAVIQSKRKALVKTNIFLITLTFVLCVFGTYLVRGGAIESLHAFGSATIGVPLIIFMLFGAALAAWVPQIGLLEPGKPLDDLMSRSGVLFMAAWFFIALGLVVGIGTMWPVISKLWSANTMGLDADFYNRVCTPLLAVLVFMMTLCPWLGWGGGVKNVKGLILTVVTFVVSCGAFAAVGITNPVANLAATSGVTVLVTIAALFAMTPGLAKLRHSYGAYGIHVGVALMAIGIAFSGPYKVEKEITLGVGESQQVGEFTITYRGMEQRSTPAMEQALGHLDVTLDGEVYGHMDPEIRFYTGFEQRFSEVAVIPALKDELYATFLGTGENNTASFKVSINPLVNWIWVGGTLMCIIALLLVRSTRKREE
ncbi:MAG: heme lyase CcmF/NrfE family subunit [Desulfovibrio sp.]